MTLEEALSLLKDHEYWADISLIDDACDIAVECMEKQIPKKPKEFGDNYSSYLCCPNCNQQIINVWSCKDYKPKYCHFCGQALDWSK